MTDGWRIDPAAARAVIADAEAESQGFPDLERDLLTALSEAVAAVAAHGPATAAKLSSIQANPFEIDLMAAKQHVDSAVSGTRQAIDAYEAGDEEMAARHENGIAQ